MCHFQFHFLICSFFIGKKYTLFKSLSKMVCLISQTKIPHNLYHISIYVMPLEYILASPPDILSSRDLTMRALRLILVASCLVIWQISASPDGKFRIMRFWLSSQPDHVSKILWLNLQFTLTGINFYVNLWYEMLN